MILKEEEILEFQRLFKEKFGEDINHEKSKKYATDLLEFMILFFKPKNMIVY